MKLLFRLALLGALMLLLTAAGVFAHALWLARAPRPAPAAVIIVLGGAMTDDNELGEETIGRVSAGVALWQAGLAPHLHFTGGAPGKGRPGAGEQMRALALELGVPPEAATAESESRSTLQNALMSRPVLGPLAEQPVILVSNGYHLARAWASFRWAGYHPVGLASAGAFGPPPFPSRARRVEREALAWWFNLTRVAVFEGLNAVAGPDPARVRLLR